jgi:hypothetical protein
MRRPDPVEIVAITIPVLAEVVSLVLFLGMITVFVALRAGA